MIALTVSLTLSTTVAGASIRVHDTRVNEQWASMDGDWLAWTTDRGVSWVRHKGSEPRRLPDRYTAVGSIKLDRPFAGSLWFARSPAGTPNPCCPSNIRRYDLRTHQVVHAPPGVNTHFSEFNVTASGDYLLFGRSHFSSEFTGEDVILYRLSTGNARKIASMRGDTRVRPGQVNGDFAVYARCKNLCGVFRYRISTRTTRKITERIGSLRQLWPAVLPDGTVYFVKGNNEPGGGVKLNRFRNNHVTTIKTFPDRVDIGRLEARMVGGTPMVLFTRIVFKPSGFADSGIYRVKG